MILAVTDKNGRGVRIEAEHSIETETARYTVHCEGAKFEFVEFAPAARMYKSLSLSIEYGDDISVALHNFAKGAKAMGYKAVYNERKVA